MHIIMDNSVIRVKGTYTMVWIKNYKFIIFYKKKRGYSLTGKTMNLHFVNLGSSPDVSKALEAQLVERNTEDV
jgi:hypothetical protein